MISIRRLSTATLYTCSKEDADFTTKWIWYYLDDECKWRGYNEMAQIKNEKAPAIDSSHVETAFWQGRYTFTLISMLFYYSLVLRNIVHKSSFESLKAWRVYKTEFHYPMSKACL